MKQYLVFTLITSIMFSLYFCYKGVNIELVPATTLSSLSSISSSSSSSFSSEEEQDMIAPDVISFVINNDDATTNSIILTLYMESSDNIGVTEMAFRNELTGTWSEWIAYSTTYTGWDDQKLHPDSIIWS